VTLPRFTLPVQSIPQAAQFPDIMLSASEASRLFHAVAKTRFLGYASE
jgi:hypothetical protein